MYFRTSELNIATSVPIPAEPKNIMKNLNLHTVDGMVRLTRLQYSGHDEAMMVSPSNASTNLIGHRAVLHLRVPTLHDGGCEYNRDCVVED